MIALIRFIFVAANAVVMVAIKPIRLGSNTTLNVVIKLYVYALFFDDKVCIGICICVIFNLYAVRFDDITRIIIVISTTMCCIQ